MNDQASDLRRLVRHSARAETPAAGKRPALVLLTSGKGGAGTTTIAVNLAVALAQQAHRTILVDADPNGGQAGLLCRLQDDYTLADVLSGRRTVAEVLQAGPAGIRVLPGVWGPDCLADCSPPALQRLLAQCEDRDAQADVILLDAGNGLNRLLPWFWQAADAALVVTTPQTASIVSTYGLIRALAAHGHAVPIHCLVNLVSNGQAAEGVQARIARVCRRFLAVRLESAGCIPADPRFPAGAQSAQPLILTDPACDASRQVGRLAKTIAAVIAGGPASMVPHRSPGRRQMRMTA